jgi:hypothetical protein
MIQNVTRPDVQEQLPLDLGSRGQVQRRYEQARQTRNVATIAYTAYSLAYSYDHCEPYDHKLAVRYLNEAVNLYPNWPEAVFNRAIAYVHLKEYSKAIDDFQRAQQLFFPSVKENNVLVRTPINVKLTRGKLLLFKAEALTGRGEGQDLARARLEILRAETALRECDISAQSVVWLSQIDERLDATFSAEERLAKGQVTVHHPVSFVMGMAMAAFLLSTLGWLMFISPPAERPTKDEPRPVTRNAKSVEPLLLSVLAGPSQAPRTTTSPVVVEHGPSSGPSRKAAGVQVRPEGRLSSVRTTWLP